MTKYAHGKPGPFTAAELRRMVAASDAGVSHAVIGKRFGVSKETVHSYVRIEKAKKGRKNAIPEA